MPRCPWATTEPNITYHDKEWGVPVHDDRMLFEFLILEGAQAGLSWDHHFQEARELSKGIRWISRGEDRPLRRTRCAAVARRHWNCAEPIENCGHHPEREGVSCSASRIRNFRRLPVELRWRQADPESVADHGGGARPHWRIRRDEPRPAATRIQIRGLNDLLRVDASNRHGQRPSRDVSATR
jgi:Methyladenine glycosylase